MPPGIVRRRRPLRKGGAAYFSTWLTIFRRERGPFKSDDALLLAAYYADSEYAALKEAGPIKTEYPLTDTPLLTLVKEIVASRYCLFPLDGAFAVTICRVRPLGPILG